MNSSAFRIPHSAFRVLVVLPNWIGDVVLATPALRAIRRQFPEARIDYLLRPYVRDVIAGTSWHDNQVPWGGLLNTAWKLRPQRYDLAILLPNSFKAALVTWLGGCRRRIGYARDGRTLLLTDPVPPRLHGDPTDAALHRPAGWPPPGPTVHRSPYAIRSVRDSYLDLAAGAGADLSAPDARQLSLATLPEDEAACSDFLERTGLAGREYVLLNPGAAFGSSKLWPADRFAELARRLLEKGWPVVVTFGPKERPLAEAIQRDCPRVTLLDDPARTIGTIKALVRHCHLMITNDTGPAHFAIAFERPLVTIFGPTNPVWTETGYPREIKVQKPVPCGPCQQKVCPLGTLVCLTSLTVDEVEASALKLIH